MYLAQSVIKCLLGTHSVPRTECSAVKPPLGRARSLPSEQLEVEAGAEGPAEAANQQTGAVPPSLLRLFSESWGPLQPPLPSKAQGALGGGEAWSSPPPPRCCPWEPVPLRVNLLARQGVTGGVCHSEPRPSALLANWGAGAGSTGNGRREGVGMRGGRLPSPPSRQAPG